MDRIADNSLGLRGRLATLIAAVALGLSGCAAFNDVVVVDIGEQASLVSADGERRETLLDRDGRGFDCRFSATSSRASLFAVERHIDGTIRCEPLTADGD